MLPNTRMSIPLSNDEFVALARLAVREMRDPRDQARYILRSVLLGDTMTNVDRRPITDPTPAATLLTDASAPTSLGR